MKTTIFSFVFFLGTITTTQIHAENAPTVTTRNILSTQLPAKLLSPIRKNLNTTWITDLYKQTVNGKVTYYITLESADQKTRLSATPATGWVKTTVVSKDVASR
ncbi:MAG: hypothetical protein JST68_27400 [Bacteroidetes bacterium]|nr:hypothetical protein [Bacteroidota bacterium]